MGQVLHGSATTTEAIRRAIQHSQASLRTLAKRYGINQKTVAKWKRRTSVADVRTGPKEARSTVLSIEDEAVGDCQESCVRGHSEAAGGRAMAIKKGTLDELLSGRDPKQVFSKDGLFDELKKALAERAPMFPPRAHD